MGNVFTLASLSQERDRAKRIGDKETYDRAKRELDALKSRMVPADEEYDADEALDERLKSLEAIRPMRMGKKNEYREALEYAIAHGKYDKGKKEQVAQYYRSMTEYWSEVADSSARRKSRS